MRLIVAHHVRFLALPEPSEASLHEAEAITGRFMAFTDEPRNALFDGYFDGTQLADPPEAIEKAIIVLADARARRGDAEGVARMRMAASRLGAVTTDPGDTALLRQLPGAGAVAPEAVQPGSEPSEAPVAAIVPQDELFALNAIRRARTRRLLRGVEAAAQPHQPQDGDRDTRDQAYAHAH